MYGLPRTCPITDLTAPAELFSISNEVQTPAPSLDESGLPDVSSLSDSGILITLFAQQLGGTSFYASGQPIAAGITLVELTDNPPLGLVSQKSGWFLDTAVGYLVRLWIGGDSAPLATADAVLRSFQPR